MHLRLPTQCVVFARGTAQPLIGKQFEFYADSQRTFIHPDVPPDGPHATGDLAAIVRKVGTENWSRDSFAK